MMIHSAPLSRIALYISEGVQVGEKKRTKNYSRRSHYLALESGKDGEARRSACAQIYFMVCVFGPPPTAVGAEFGGREDAIGSQPLHECYTEAFRARAERVS